MAIPSRPLSQDPQSQLLWNISKQMESLICVTACGSGSGSGTSGSSGTSGLTGTSGSSGITGTSGLTGTNGSSGLSGDRYRTDSVTEFTLGTSTTLTVGTGLSYTVAQDIIIAYNSTNHQICSVVSYDSGTGILVIGPPITVVGSGTYSDWTVNLNGAAGGDGSSGTSGSSGTNGSSGLTGTSGSSGLTGASGTSGSSGTAGTSGSAGTAGLAGTAGTSGTSNATASFGLFSQTADSTPVTATAVETTIIGAGVGTLSVPANAFSIGDSFLCALDGLISCTSASTVHIRVKTLGGTILADTGIIDLAAATGKSWIMNLYFTVRTLGGTGTASISSGGLFSYIRNGGTQFEGYVLSQLNTTTFDTTISNTLVITAQWDTADVDNSIFSRNFTLTKVY